MVKVTPPKVTVVTPTFNRAHLIRETISSVLAQTFREFEYIVVDDGSVDDTKSAVLSFEDPRIAYFWHENRGEAASTNRGWSMGRGDYFAVLSSDDTVAPTWLERMVAVMEDNPEIVVAYPDWTVINEKSEIVSQVLAPDYDRNSMISSFHPSPGVGALIRRSALRDVIDLRNAEYRYAPDLDCWLRLSLRGPFEHLPEPLAAWRTHEGSITVADRNHARAAEMVRIAKEFFAREDLPASVRQLRAHAVARAHVTAWWVVQETHPLRAALYLRGAYRASPVELDNLPSYLRRPACPDRQQIMRLARNTARHRAYPLLRAIGRRLPSMLRVSGARLLVRAGLVDAARLQPPPAPSLPELREAAARSVDNPDDSPEGDYESQPVCTQPATNVHTEGLAGSAELRRFDGLLTQITTDLAALSDTVSPLSPTPRLLEAVRNAAGAPSSSRRGSAARMLFDRLPAQIDHLLLLPWLGISGGAETVTERLIEALKQHYGRTRCVCVLATDVAYRGTAAAYQGLPFVSFSELGDDLTLEDRTELLDRVLIQRQPRSVHCLNSHVGWRAIRSRGASYAGRSALFANVYSDIRLEDGSPAATFYYDFLPHCIQHLDGVIADNRAIADKAVVSFGMPTELKEKLHVVRTPVIGLHSQDPQRDLRPFQRSQEARSLWLSRIAKEKRLDVLAEVARRSPQRHFTAYGSTNGVPVDLTDLRKLSNVEIAGEFEHLNRLPFDRFDSYVFTSSGEGMPIALLEIASKGLPIVAPDIGGISELVDENTGWLVSGPASVSGYLDALAQIADDPREAGRRVDSLQAALLRDYTFSAFCDALARIPNYLVRAP